MKKILPILLTTVIVFVVVFVIQFVGETMIPDGGIVDIFLVGILFTIILIIASTVLLSGASFIHEVIEKAMYPKKNTFIVSVWKRYDVNGSFTHDIELKLGLVYPDENSMWRFDCAYEIDESNPINCNEK